jgi:hypothetical protein
MSKLERAQMIAEFEDAIFELKVLALLNYMELDRKGLIK